jgi:hypothetical protein
VVRQTNLVVAKNEHIEVDAPSHVSGVKEGNWPGSRQKESGIEVRGDRVVATARRSTGIAPEDREPIDPASPCLTPA